MQLRVNLDMHHCQHQAVDIVERRTLQASRTAQQRVCSVPSVGVRDILHRCAVPDLVEWTAVPRPSHRARHPGNTTDQHQPFRHSELVQHHQPYSPPSHQRPMKHSGYRQGRPVSLYL